MDDDKDTRMTSPMLVDESLQGPSVHDPSGITTDPTEVDVKLSPDAMRDVSKIEQGTGLAAELRQLEPTGERHLDVLTCKVA